jgi:hypothetical protein
VVLEVLHCFFVRLCRASRGERPKIPPLSGLGILFPRIQAIFTRFHFSNHMKISAAGLTCSPVACGLLSRRRYDATPNCASSPQNAPALPAIGATPRCDLAF